MPRQTPGVQLQYRSYLHPMSIYHVSIAIMPLKELFYHLKNSEIGFLRTIIGEDPPSSPAEGDETPVGSIEVIYMPLVLAKGGSSLGFRITDGKKKIIEWLCFGGPVQGRIEGMEKDGQRVFDFVAKLEKSDNPKRGVVSGHKEHRDLFESLEYGELRLFNLKLTWRNKVQELQAAMERSGRTARARVQDQMETVRTEVGNMVVSIPKGTQYIQNTRGAIPLEATDRYKPTAGFADGLDIYDSRVEQYRPKRLAFALPLRTATAQARMIDETDAMSNYPSPAPSPAPYTNL